MNLQDIRKILKTIPQKEEFTLCKEAFNWLELVETVLQGGFGVDRLTLYSVHTDIDRALLRGTAGQVQYLRQRFTDIQVTFSFTEDKNGLVMYAEPVLPPSFSPIPGLPGQFGFISQGFQTMGSGNYLHVFGIIQGEFIYKDISLPVQVDYTEGTREWTVLTGGGAKAQDISISEAFAMLGIPGYETLLPSSVRALIQAAAVTELELAWDMEAQSLLEIGVGLAITHKDRWVLMQGLAIDGITLKIQVDFRGEHGYACSAGTAGFKDTAVDIAITGVFLLDGGKLPVSVFYRGSEGSFGVLIEPGGGFVLSDFSILEPFVGAISADSLPAGYSCGRLVLESLSLTVGSRGSGWRALPVTSQQAEADAAAVQAFSLAVRLENPLSMAGIFSIDEVCFNDQMFRAENRLQYEISLFGRFTIAETLPFGLRAVKTSELGWAVTGYTLGPDEIMLSDLLYSLCDGIFPEELPLPGFGLSSLCFQCSLGSTAFSISAGVFIRGTSDDFLTFESIAANINIHCEKKTAAWAYSVKIKDGIARMFSSEFRINFTYEENRSFFTLEWLPQTAGTFNLEAFCRGLGMEEFALPEFLNISLKRVIFHYDLAADQLILDTATDSGGRLYFKTVKVNGTCRYLMAAALPFEVSFASLPLVGGAVPLLDEVHLQNLQAVMVSHDMEAEIPGMLPKTKLTKGFMLMSALSLPGKVQPLCLPVDLNQIRAADTMGARGVSMKVEKDIGPFSLHQLHLSFAGGTIWFGLDASLADSSLSFVLDGLGIGYDIGNERLTFQIDGLSLDVHRDPLTLGGSFLRRSEEVFEGSLLLGLKAFNLTAVGSYTLGKISSVFLFALLRANIGGPPCFSVTGFAVGFGYNRDLVIPDIDELTQFPFLKAADGLLSEQEIFRNEMVYFPPRIGKNWFSAGILFNNFKMADGFALLWARLGNETEIGLLGRAVLTVPFGLSHDSKVPPIVYAALLLKASIQPSTGLVSVEAALSNDSYILSGDCHLTGGFAFYAWFGGERAGDFVLSLGGYSDSYKKPAHYPDVKRLGLEWRLSHNLSVSGSIYFALTPSCIMAGGYMKLMFDASVVQAWLDASVNVCIQWQPYRYELDLAVSVGVKVDLRLFTVRLELSCMLNIWGPDFCGKAHIKLWCISFTIGFGNAAAPPKEQYLEPGQFVRAFLPQAQSRTADADTSSYEGISIQAVAGLVSTCELDGGKVYWNMNAYAFGVLTKSMVPSTGLEFNGVSYTPQSGKHGEPPERLYVRPCQGVQLSSVHTVTLARQDGTGLDADFDAAIQYENVPAALWGAADLHDETVYAATGLLLSIVNPNSFYALSGLVGVHAEGGRRSVCIPELPWKKQSQENPYGTIKHILDQTVDNKRTALLHDLGMDGAGIKLKGLAEDPACVFSAKPYIANIGGE